MFPKLFQGLFGRNQDSAPKSKVSITAVNLKFMGNTHSLSGISVESSVFDYTIPFQNKMGSDHLPDNLKGPSMKISNITVSDPFKLIEVSPKLPVEVPYMSKTAFKLKIKAPDVTYDGPISINFGNDPSENIAINIKKVTLIKDAKSVDLENSEMMSTMQKGQVFKKEIQLYKILSLNDTVKSIAVSKPFELVSVTPGLPLIADKKDSYIISLFIKAPTFSYAGNLDIKLG